MIEGNLEGKIRRRDEVQANQMEVAGERFDVLISQKDRHMLDAVVCDTAMRS
jgi:hypothetical protein